MKLVVTVVLAVRAGRVEVRVRVSFTYDGAGCDFKQDFGISGGSWAANKPRHRLYTCSAGTVVLATDVLSLRLMYVSVYCTPRIQGSESASPNATSSKETNTRQIFDKHC